MSSKLNELNSSIKLINNRLNFIGTVGNNEPISIDYIPPYGDNLGYTSLELLLLSLSSCYGSTMLIFLKNMNKTIKNLEINSAGIRKEDHPTGFKKINLEINLESEDIEEEEMHKIIEITESYCPVFDMVKGNVEIKISYSINDK